MGVGDVQSSSQTHPTFTNSTNKVAMYLLSRSRPPHSNSKLKLNSPKDPLPRFHTAAHHNASSHLSRLRSRTRCPRIPGFPSHLPQLRPGREMRAEPSPPSARPGPIAAGRARVAASPRVTSRNLATPPPSLRSGRRGAFAAQNGDGRSMRRGVGGGRSVASRAACPRDTGKPGAQSAAPAPAHGGKP